MTESTPRRIDGLRPRAAGEQDLSRLQRRNRQSDPEHAATPDGPPAATISASPAAAGGVVALDAPLPTVGTSTGNTVNGSREQPKTKTTVYLDRGIQGRARAAYRATGHLENDRSWSEFIEKAIQREVHRREEAHNAGEAYGEDTTPLTPGRPIG